ncbi:MAG: EAL domain-containing protein [Alteromonadaceae bacterium]|jgi:c-di-GMP-related signal transduction protein|uniref:EAL domain-containing protein n=1 Tax=Rheinheimera aquimaris TaxID=412437 RepID=A0ABN1ECY3_9GAMM|nr:MULTISPECIES: HDOD domain-containing protein [Rheinheimera]MBJ91592.1 EAL domain-containing protein [Alteromonadaceae bacterium]MCB5215269.1 HDOD domain-containing protein [Rheinheimera aquimaris]MCD1598341.1 HDOD domain-containing protein [Rheinheimera aquimaris]HBN89683.1 EAL domain-containing protein [Rheinheimera sp.]|tara:strand:+ start:5114 stop:6334 length:1221 start_codon:yes stop_codon:yes gene_type:complete
MYFYAARQPILDRNKELYAYELLFRDGLENAFPDVDGDEATSRMVEGSQFSFGLDDFLGDKPGFINFTLDTLQKKYPSMLPKEQVVIEILETIQPGKRLLAECQQLKEQGYVLALDDYIHQGVWRHFYPFIDIIKIDFRSTAADTINEIKLALTDFPHIKLLAEKVETNEEFQLALDMGFSYFQGYFFSKPEMMQSKALAPAQMTLAELLYETSKADMDLNKITQVFQRDVHLSYKLLRYSNSAIFKRRTEIETIKQALVVLGQAELKKFLSLLFTSQISSDKPAELMRMSMTRARFAEGLAELHGKVDTAKAFLTGLMSLMDAILDEPIDSVMNKLPLAKEIKEALIEKKGLLADYIQLIQYYEKAQWKEANQAINTLQLPNDKVPDSYHTAVQWANEQMKALGD